jgi:hypothetical protein
MDKKENCAALALTNACLKARKFSSSPMKLHFNQVSQGSDLA